MAFINIDDTNRIVAASYDFHCGDNEIEVTIPEEIELVKIHEYKYINNKFVHDPLPIIEPEVIPSQLDVIEAQVTYTAMITDTLLTEV